jgi:hypothetical protein
MNTSFIRKTPMIVATILGLSLAQAGTMSKTDYDAGKTRIGADYKNNDARCGSFAGNARDVCTEDAMATQRIARAELESTYTGTESDHGKVLVEKAESAFAVAKAKCGAKAGNDKDVCIEEARASETTMLSDIKMGKAISDARSAAAADVREADYKVAAQKCDVYSGEAKDNCVAAAKARFGKS